RWTHWKKVVDEPHQPVRVLVWEGSKQHGVDDAENGGVGADTEREGQDRGGREHRRAGQLPNRIGRVLTKVVDQLQAPRFAAPLLPAHLIAELASSPCFSLGTGRA